MLLPWRSPKQSTLNTLGKRVVVVIGGSGHLGRAFLSKLPHDMIAINVSQRRLLWQENVFNYPYDLRLDLDSLVKGLRRLVPSVDVLVNMAYSRDYTSIADFRTARFLKEMELDVAVPTRLSLLCGERFWSKSSKEENLARGRKIINLSSEASFGITERPELATYSGAKSALNMMTSYLHQHAMAAWGVSAHIVAPPSLADMRYLEATVASLWNLAGLRTQEHQLIRPNLLVETEL